MNDVTRTRLETALPLFGALIVVIGLAYAASNVDRELHITTLRLDGLSHETAADAITELERAVRKIDGVRNAVVGRKTGTLRVRHDRRADMKAVERTVAANGFKVKKPEPTVELHDERELLW